jgi:hypothetical protein
MPDILGPYVLQDGDAEVVLHVQLYDQDGQTVFGIYTIEGRIPLKPKQWLKTVRSGLQELEWLAREAGCTEVRMVGRFKKNMLPDYDEYKPANGGYGLRKALK